MPLRLGRLRFASSFALKRKKNFSSVRKRASSGGVVAVVVVVVVTERALTSGAGEARAA